MAMASAIGPIAKKEKELEKLKMEIRSILITAGRNGATAEELQRDYEDLNGKRIQMGAFGFNSMAELIKTMPDVIDVRVSSDGHVRLFAQSHEATKRIENLISKQRQSRPSRFGGTEQQQQTAEERRMAADRKRLIEKRMIEIASRGNGFIAYTDLCRKYRTTYGEVFDPKVEFNCNAKAVFTSKFGRSFTVVGKGVTGGFLVRLKDTVRSENRNDSMGGENVPTAASASRYSTSSGQAFGYSRTASFGGGPGSQSYRGRSTGFGVSNRGRGGFSAPRFAAAASNRLQASALRFGGSSAENMASVQNRYSAPARASASGFSNPNQAYGPLSVTVSTGPRSGQTSRSVSAPSAAQSTTTTAVQQQSRQVSALGAAVARASPTLLKAKISNLISKYPGGIEMSMFKESYRYHFNQECDPGILDFIRHSCADICELVWNESSMRYHVKPKSDPFSSMSTLGSALPSAQPQQPPPPPPTVPKPQPLPTTRPKSPPRTVLSSEELRQQLKRVLRSHPNGISYLSFPKAFKAITGRDLDLSAYDFLSLRELVESMPDVFRSSSKSGDIILYETQPARDVPVSVEKKPEVAMITGTAMDFSALMDRFWVIAMNAPRRCLHLALIPSAYQKTFGHPLPVKDLEDLSMKNELFDYVDQFDFLYEGGLNIIAQPSYKPSDESLLQFLVENGTETSTAGQPLDEAEYVMACEQFSFQTFPNVQTNLEDFRHEVVVVQIDSPGRFFVRLQSMHDELESLIRDMTDFYDRAGRNTAVIPSGQAQLALPCAYQYEDGGYWCRALITQVNEGGDVTLLLVDFGTEIVTTPEKLRYLRRSFFSLPSQAIECHLAYLSPTGESWTQEAGEVMAHICGNSVLVAELVKVVDGVTQIHLAKPVENGSDIYLNDALVNSNLALFKENDGSVALTATESQDEAEGDDETGSGGETSSVLSFQTAVEDETNLIDFSTPLSTPQGPDPEVTKLMDLSFEQDVIGQLKAEDWDQISSGWERMEVITMAKTVLCRKRVALLKKLDSGGHYDLIVEKLSWLEEQVNWLSAQEDMAMTGN